MARFVRWACLILGAALLLWVGALVAELARLTAPLGGIPWSWSLLRLNIGWAIAAAAGIFLIGVCANLFVRARRRNSN
jgi:zinc transporter ZupT